MSFAIDFLDHLWSLIKVLLVFIAICLVWIVLSMLYSEVKFALKRTGLGEEEFVAEFSKEGVFPEVAKAVYAHFSRFSRLRPAMVAPDECLEHVYSVDDEYLWDTAVDICGSLAIELPKERVLRRWKTPIKTVGDFVRWLDWVKRRSEAPEDEREECEAETWVPSLWPYG